MPLKKFSVGAQVLDYTAGAGNYNVFGFVASGAYDQAIDRFGNHHFSFGLQLGLIQKSINFDKLTWDSQYIQTGTGGFDQTIGSGENFGKGSYILPDVNEGAIYYFAKVTSRVNTFIGFTAFHLTQHKKTFLGTNDKLTIRYTLHGGLKKNIYEKYSRFGAYEMHQHQNYSKPSRTIIFRSDA